MKFLACSLVLLGALYGPTPAYAQDEAAAAARRLVVRSGLSVQLRSVHKGFEQQTAQLRGQMPPALLGSLERAGKEAFRPEVLQRDIERVLPDKLTLPEMQKALAWLETEAGRRITLAEEIASTTLDDAALSQHAKQLQAKPMSAKRKQMMQDLMSATGALDSTADLIEATSLAVAIGMDSTQPAQKRLGVPALRAQLQRAMPRAGLKKQLSASLPAIFAYTYREVAEADIAAYLKFLRGADGRKYNQAMVDAFSQAVVGASMRLGHLVER